MAPLFSRRQFSLLLGSAAIVPALPASAGPEPPGSCPIVTPIDAATQALLEHTPEIATYGGVPGSADGGPFARRMDDYSPRGEEAWRTALGETGIAIERID